MKPHGRFLSFKSVIRYEAVQAIFSKLEKFSEASRLPYGQFLSFKSVIRIITCAVRTESPPARAIFAFYTKKNCQG